MGAAADEVAQGAWREAPLFAVVPGHLTLAVERSVLETAGVCGSFRLRVLAPARFAQALLGLLGRPVPDLLQRDEVCALAGLLARQRFPGLLADFGDAAQGVIVSLVDDILRLIGLTDPLPELSGDDATVRLARGLLPELRKAFRDAAPEPELLRRALPALEGRDLRGVQVMSVQTDRAPVQEALLQALEGAGAAVRRFPAADIFAQASAVPSHGLPVREGVQVRTRALRSLADEAMWVARTCRDLVRLGADPEQIAVGYADDALRPTLTRALRSARVAVAEEQAQPVRLQAAAEGLLDLVAGVPAARALLRVAESGLVPPPGTERDQILADLRGPSSHRSGPPAEGAARWLGTISPALDSWPLFGTVEEHFAHFFEVLSSLGVPAALEQLQGADAEGYRDLAEAARRLARAFGDARVPRGDAVGALRQILGGVARPTGIPPLGAVRLGPCRSLAGLQADHVLLCGLDEGHFPQTQGLGVLPQTIFEGTPFSSAARHRAAEEEARLCLTAARRTLWLSHARRGEDGDDQAASDLIGEEGVWPPPLADEGDPTPDALCGQALSRQQLGRSLAVVLARLRELGRDPGPYLPLLAALRTAGVGAQALAGLARRPQEPRVRFAWEDPVRLTVTELERHARCAFRWFAEGPLGLGREEDPEDFDLLQQGSIVHAVLAGLAGSDLQAEALAQWVELEVDRAVEQGDYPKLRGGGAARTLRGHLAREILRVAEMVVAEQRLSAFAVLEREYPVEMPLEHEGRSVWVKGRIDRLERSSGGWLRVLDYKVRTRHSFDLGHFWHGLDLQVGAYGLWLRGQEERFAGRLGALEYWAIRPTRMSGQGRPPGEAEQVWRSRRPVGLHRADPGLARELGGAPFAALALTTRGEVRKGQTVLTDEEWEAALDRVQRVLRTQVEGILRGEVAPDPYRLRRPRSSENACERCDLQAVCGFLPEAGDAYREMRSIAKEDLTHGPHA